MSIIKSKDTIVKLTPNTIGVHRVGESNTITIYYEHTHVQISFDTPEQAKAAFTTTKDYLTS